MFIGQQLQQNQPLFLLTYITNQSSVFLLTNAALSKNSHEAQLYLIVENQKILICELSRQLKILQNTLNVQFQVDKKTHLISQNGNIHICGHYQNTGLKQSVKILKPQTETSKRSLESKFSKSETILVQSPISKPIQKSEEIKQQISSVPVQRKSLRLSSQYFPNPESVKTNKKQQKSSKMLMKQQKLPKNKQKSEQIKSNGRYNLKSLIQNINQESSEDSDQDDDLQDSKYESSDDDYQSDENDCEQDSNSVAPSLILQFLEDSELFQTNEKNQKVENNQKENKSNSSMPLQIDQQQEQEQQQKKLLNLQYQQKWPQTTQPEIEKQINKRQKRIEELARKIRFPTIKPTI